MQPTKDKKTQIRGMSRVIHKQYHSVLEYEDARQHVRMCLWLCLKYYDPQRFKFMTYFYSSFERLRKSLYYEYRSQIDVRAKTNDNIVSYEGCNSDEPYTVKNEERSMSYTRKTSTGIIEIDIRCKLSNDCVPVFDLYMRSFKISPWLVSKELKISRYDGRIQYRKFLKEVANLLEVGA